MISRVFFITAVLLFALYSVHSARAHGGEPRLEISVESLNPGGVVEVRGVDFEPEELITFALIGHEFEFPLGQIIADTDGIFLQIIALPTDLLEGVYNFRAITDDHEIISPTLTVFGSAISEGGGEGPREEDDGLLAPMPTFAPAVPTVSVPSAPVAGTPAVDWNPNVLVLVVLLVLAIIVVFGLKRRNTQ